MTPQKIVKDFQDGKPVDTQELAKTMWGESKFIATAPFDFKRWFELTAKHYEPGDEFTPPEGMTRDTTFDEFRHTGVRKGKIVNGITFTEIGDVVSGDARDRNNPDAERNVYRNTLPVKEA